MAEPTPATASDPTRPDPTGPDPAGSLIDQDATAYLRTVMPFMARLGAETILATPQEVRLRLRWAEERCTAGGILHGGALMTLADGAAAWCARLNVPAGDGTTTIESKTNFLRAVRRGFVEAVARPLHVGGTTIVVDTLVYDADHRLVARTSQTQAVLPAR
jgi:1,4-dihydroxy-2-naphthoyl-CoA hydrolase